MYIIARVQFYQYNLSILCVQYRYLSARLDRSITYYKKISISVNVYSKDKCTTSVTFPQFRH